MSQQSTLLHERKSIHKVKMKEKKTRVIIKPMSVLRFVQNLKTSENHIISLLHFFRSFIISLIYTRIYIYIYYQHEGGKLFDCVN